MADRTPLGEALREAGYAFRASDFSRQTWELMQRKRLLAEELRGAFAAEGHSWLYDHLVAESADPRARYEPDRAEQRRYLYHARPREAPWG